MVLLATLSCSQDDKSSESTFALRQRGFAALHHGDVKTALNIGDQLIAKRNDKTAVLYGHILIGQTYILLEDTLDNSQKFLKEAEKESIELKNDSALASVYNGLGLYALNREMNEPLALEYFFKGLELAEKTGNRNLQAIMLSNIALIYYSRLDQFGFQYAQECYNYGKETNDNFLRFIGASTSANYYLINGELDQALEMVKEAENLGRDKAYHGMSHVYSTYGTILWKLNRPDAGKMFQKSVENMEASIDDNVRPVIAYSDFLYANGRSKEAIQLLLNTEKHLYPDSPYYFSMDLYMALSEIFKKEGNTTLSGHYQRLYEEQKVLHEDHERESQLKSLRSKHDFQRAENIRMKSQIEEMKRLQILYGMAFIILLAAAIIIPLIFMYRKKSRLYNAIVKQSAENVRTEKLLRETIRGLEGQIKFTDTNNKPTQSIRSEESEEKDNYKAEIESTSPDDDKYRDILCRLETLMTDSSVYTASDVTRDKVAKLIDTNRSYLSKAINSYYRVTFTQFINQLRIREAVRILSDINNDTPLKQLASDLGFNSISTFYTQFSAETGMTPAVFRERAHRLATQ